MHRLTIPLVLLSIATSASSSRAQSSELHPTVIPSERSESRNLHSVSPSIAFASKRDGNWEIHLVSLDGTQRTRLTSRPEQDRFPLWSPNGTKLAFGAQ